MINDIVLRLLAGSDTSSVDKAPLCLLLLGAPSVGKTTLLRDIASRLGERRRTVIVDTSNEIAGPGFVPHTSIGRCHRMQVSDRAKQHSVLVEAIQNQSPQVVVIDEIGSSAEVAAVRSIAQRGVSLIATAHGTSLQSLMKNPELVPLIGGIATVTIGDAMARERRRRVGDAAATKTILERKGAPVFGVVVEVLSRDIWRIHSNVADTVDCLLDNRKARVEIRTRRNGDVFARHEEM